MAGKKVSKKKKVIKRQIVTGKFRNTAILEGNKQASVLELKPTSSKHLAVIVTNIPHRNTHLYKHEARESIAGTGISKAAIKKLGL